MTPKEIAEKIQRSGPIMMVPSADLQLLAAGYLEAAKDSERLRAELKVRVNVKSPDRADGVTGRVRNAYLCGFESAWHGEKYSGVYRDSTSDYSRAECRGYLDGRLQVKEAIDAAIGGKS